MVCAVKRMQARLYRHDNQADRERPPIGKDAAMAVEQLETGQYQAVLLHIIEALTADTCPPEERIKMALELLDVFGLWPDGSLCDGCAGYVPTGDTCAFCGVE